MPSLILQSGRLGHWSWRWARLVPVRHVGTAQRQRVAAHTDSHMQPEIQERCAAQGQLKVTSVISIKLNASAGPARQGIFQGYYARQRQAMQVGISSYQIALTLARTV